jgi:hypothetical protein
VGGPFRLSMMSTSGILKLFTTFTAAPSMWMGAAPSAVS